MNRIVTPIIIVAVIAAGIWYVTRPQEQALGAAPAALTAQATTPIAQLTKEQVGQEVTIEGVITKECPTGCWAIVKDDTGVIRIDTKAGSFTLPLRKEGSAIKAQGILKLSEGGDLELSAKTAEVR